MRQLETPTNWTPESGKHILSLQFVIFTKGVDIVGRSIQKNSAITWMDDPHSTSPSSEILVNLFLNIVRSV